MSTGVTAIVDYGLGNTFSVSQALAHVGLESCITNDPKVIGGAAAVVLPGVGAFGDAMNRLNDKGLSASIRAFIDSGRPLLGICLGMQLLFDCSAESPEVAGLGLLPGGSFSFPAPSFEYKVPQIQWNEVKVESASSVLLGDLGTSMHMYFLHSYYVVPKDVECVSAVTEYAGLRYCCAIERSNVLAVQFHPEKSGEAGLHILKNFREFVRQRQ